MNAAAGQPEETPVRLPLARLVRRRPYLTAFLLIVAALTMLFVMIDLASSNVWAPFEAVRLLAVGWFTLPRRTFAQMHARWAMVAGGVAYFVAFILGAHLALRWLWRHVCVASSEFDQAKPAPTNPMAWRVRWTLAGVVAVVLMFAIGVSAIGIYRCVEWMQDPTKPTCRVTAFNCSYGLHFLYRSLSEYAKEHNGNYPRDLMELAAWNSSTDSYAFACAVAASDEGRVSGPSLVPWLSEHRPEMFDYFGKGLKLDGDSNAVLAVDPPVHHADEEFVVLYGDGHVELMGTADGADVLKRLGYVNASPTTADRYKPQEGTKP